MSELKKGVILLAEPFMVDPNFKRSAVLLCEHGKEGSVGFVLNHPLSHRVDMLIEDFPEFDAHVYLGGPVEADSTLHYLHNVGDLLENSVKVSRGIYWGGDFDKLKFLISNELIQPHNIRFFIGYSGWETGQLDEELKSGSWVIADNDINYLFNNESDNLWKEIMENKGNTFSVIARMSDSSLN